MCVCVCAGVCVCVCLFVCVCVCACVCFGFWFAGDALYLVVLHGASQCRIGASVFQMQGME